MKNRNAVLLIALATLALLLPFINKPFNLDDPFYIKMAQQILKDPLRPYSFSINWSGVTKDVWTYNEATFPPLVPYYLALVIKFFGLREWVLHLAFLPFSLLAVLGMYALSKRFVREPLLPTFLFAASPAFLVSATGIMLDIPMTALILASVVLFVRGVDDDKKGLVALSMALAGLALLVKYTSFLVLVLFAFYALRARKEKYLFFLAVPLALFALWCWHNYFVYGDIHLLRVGRAVGKGLSTHKVIGVLTFLSGCLVFPVFSFAFIKKDNWEWRFIVIAALAVFVFAYRLFAQLPQTLYFTLLASSTLLFFYKASRAWDGVDKFLSFWFLLSLLMVILLEPWTAGRYFLIFLPPALIVFSTMCERYAVPPRLTAAAAALTLLVGIAAAAGDYVWAGTYPKIAAYVKEKGYDHGYFVGHFGFQYYLEKAGMEHLELNADAIRPGYVIIALVPDPQKPDDKFFAVMKHIEHKNITSRYPVRVMNPWARAGFYSSFWGIFPFSVSNASLDEFLIYYLGGEDTHA